MIATPRRPISLVEHESILLAQDEMTWEEGVGLWRRYRDHVEVTFPALVTSGNWRLSARGWVGHLPVSDEFAVEVKPKVGVHNLFRMLEYAYRLKSFRFLDDLFRADTVQDLYERLAGLLSRLVLDRTRRGLYRAYLTRSEQLAYVRGRLEARELSLRPWTCHAPTRTTPRTLRITASSPGPSS